MRLQVIYIIREIETGMVDPVKPSGEDNTPNFIDLKSGASRNIALVIDHWSNATLSWTWTKNNFLRVCGFAVIIVAQLLLTVHTPSILQRRSTGTLHPFDHLFIVRPRTTDEDDQNRWKRGGPLIKDIQSALMNYPHTTVELDSPFKLSLGKFVKESNIDVVVVGDEFRQKAFHLGQTVADFVRQNTSVPFIIMRPEAVRLTQGFCLNNSQSLSMSMSVSGERDLSPTRLPTTSRKIAIAYPANFSVGRALIAAARKLVLLETDEIYLVHVFPKEKSVMNQTKKFVRTMTLQRQLERSVTADNCMLFGAKELEGFPNVHLNVCLKGDPKTALPAFCEAEGIHLLVIGTHTEGLLKKTFSGGSVSGTLVEKSPCLSLLVPYSYLGIDSYEGIDSPASPRGISPRGSGNPSFGNWGSGELSPAPNADAMAMVASLKKELTEKDKIIAQLQAELARMTPADASSA